MKNILLSVKIVSWIFIIFFLFLSCCFLIISFHFGDDADFALVLSHISLIKSYPLMPYLKEIVLGIISFLCLTCVALRYWKISVIFCLLVSVTFFIKCFSIKTLPYFKKSI